MRGHPDRMHGRQRWLGVRTVVILLESAATAAARGLVIAVSIVVATFVVGLLVGVVTEG